MSTAFDAKIGGLELATHYDVPVAGPMAKGEDKYPYHLPDGLQVSYPEKPSSPPVWPVFRLRPTTVILSVALALVTLLAVVAAAVGGSLAAKNAHVYGILTDDLRKGREANGVDSTATIAHPSASPVPQTFNSSCPVVNGTTASPTDDCTQLSPTFVSSLSAKAEFNLSCNTAFHDYNILGVFVYRFEDCMEACASYNHFQSSNTTCHGATFDLRRPQQGGKGNCFLKDTRGINSTALNGVSSAEVVLR